MVTPAPIGCREKNHIAVNPMPEKSSPEGQKTGTSVVLFLFRQVFI
jgi:hypothetical protein